MKKFIMTFLVASMVIATGLSLSSCKKTDTNANMEEWVPIVYEYVNPDGDQGNTRQGDPQIPCYYSGAPIYCNQPLVRCPHDLPFVNQALYCEEHSHVHCFEANQDCTAPNQISNCEYKGHRKHYHIITYNKNYYFHGWHVGGGVCPF